MEIRQIFWLLPTTIQVYQEKDKGQRCCCYCIPIDSFWSKGSLLFFLVMSDKGSDTIITLIGSVKNVGIIPHKNVDHATPWAAGNRGPYGQPITEYWATEEAKRRWLPRRNAFLNGMHYVNYPTYFLNLEKELQYWKVDCLILISNFKILPKSW